MRRVERLTSQPAWALGGIAAIAVPLFVTLGMPSYWVYLSTTATVLALLCLSVGVVFGRAGMVALCPMAFAAIGALATALANHWRIDLPFPVLILAAGLVTVPFGVAVGLPALRLRGLNLAIVTLSFALAVHAIVNTVGFPGGEALEVVPRPDWASDDPAYFLVCWAGFVAASVVLSWVGARRGGAAWLAVRSSERGTAATGLSVPRVKLMAFAASAFLAGVAGSLLAGELGQLNATGFDPLQSLTIFALAVMVGARYPEGAALGGMLAAFLPELLREVDLPQDLAGVIFAVGAALGLAKGSGGAAADLRAAGRRLFSRYLPPGRLPKPSIVDVSDSRRERPAGTEVVLDTRDLSVRYGAVIALDDVSVRVCRGELHALIGPNGAGKSTFVDAVNGFTRLTAGNVAICGVDSTTAPVHLRARAGLRRTFQHERTVADLTVREYTRLVAPDADPRDRDTVLAQFGCPALDIRLSSVDVGRRRLVEVAAAVLARPSVLLLDEPAAGLDAVESRQLGRRLAEIPTTYGCGVLLIEHDVEMVAAISDRVTVLDFGRVIASGPPAEVLADPAVRAAYLGAEVTA